MNVTVFNACLLIGWLLVLVGGVLRDVATGLLIAGSLLLVLTLVVAWLAGIVQTREAPAREGEGG